MKGHAMHSRCLLIAAAALAMATIAVAEPVKPVPQPAQPPERPTEIVMASAEQLQTPPPVAAQARDALPVKRPRAARATSCRCAGQN